jgi:hypothetical protein
MGDAARPHARRRRAGGARRPTAARIAEPQSSSSRPAEVGQNHAAAQPIESCFLNESSSLTICWLNDCCQAKHLLAARQKLCASATATDLGNW